MKKDAVISKIYEKVGKEAVGSKAALTHVYDAVFDTIAEELAAGESIGINGFGKFEVRDKPASAAHNPRTGQQILVPKHKVAVWSASSTLKKKLNT